ncbi:MAG: ribonuclease domain-containing protein [Pirellulaceae bacterium]|nr:ribonuclease domain-containing protein [Pirellulaceae bacterium]
MAKRVGQAMVKGKGSGQGERHTQIIIPPWMKFIVAIVALAVALVGYWQGNYGGGWPKIGLPQTSSPQPVPAQPPATSTPDPTPATTDAPLARPQNPPAAAEPTESPTDSANIRTTIPDQTILDESGDEAFRGTIDVGPTLTRIQAGERLSRFPNDGSTFQNREGRLPRKPAGYYKEYVHPTPGLSGPGPQRLVIGEQGETYYTADHYRTFQRLDE